MNHIRGVTPTRFQTGSDEMRSFGQNDAGMRRFVSFIRAKIMGVAAQNVVGSKLIRDIHAAAAREKLAEFKAGIVEKEFDFLVNENEDLRQEVIRKDERISALEASLEFHKDRIEQLEDKCANAASDLRAEGNESTVPARGEVRYYKKIGNKNGVDIMRHVDDCGHREGAWQPAFRADQAEKGIEKFEGTRSC